MESSGLTAACDPGLLHPLTQALPSKAGRATSENYPATKNPQTLHQLSLPLLSQTLPQNPSEPITAPAPPGAAWRSWEPPAPGVLATGTHGKEQGAAGAPSLRKLEPQGEAGELQELTGQIPAVPATTAPAIPRQQIAGIAGARGKAGEGNHWCLLAPDGLLTHSVWLHMKGHPAGKNHPQAHTLPVRGRDRHLRDARPRAATRGQILILNSFNLLLSLGFNNPFRALLKWALAFVQTQRFHGKEGRQNLSSSICW